MKILIVGCGDQGSVIATELVKEPDVSEVRLSYYTNLERAGRLAERLKSSKVSIHRVDGTKFNDVLGVAEGVDVIVNATRAPEIMEGLPVSHRICLTIMDVALKIGAHYQDFTGSAIQKQLEQSDKWKEAGLTALVATGVWPGMTNIMAAHAADRLDRVDEIHIRCGCKVLEEPKEIIPTLYVPSVFAPPGKPIVYENGEYKELPMFSGEEVYTFPEPIGPLTIWAFGSLGTVYTFPIFIGKGLKRVDAKTSGGCFFLPMPLKKAMFQLGLYSEKPIEVKGVKVVPREVLMALTPPTPSMEDMEDKYKAGVLGETKGCLVVEVNGEKTGKKVKHTLYMPLLTIREIQERLPGANTTSYLTSVPASILTKMLGRGEIETKGVIPPEGLEPEARKAFLGKLAEKGLTVHEVVERHLA